MSSAHPLRESGRPPFEHVDPHLAGGDLCPGCGGLPPGKVEEAFAPFVRLDSRQSGFGLGLAIAKQAVDAHGGSIRVQNMPGKGCVFVLELPVESQGAVGSPAV